MSYSPDMNGLELFAAPFRSPHTKAPASRPQQAKATAPQPKAATAVPPMPQPQTVKPEAQEASSQPVKAKPQMEQPRKPNIPQNPVPDEKNPALQEDLQERQARATPEPEQKPEKATPAPAKATEPELEQKPKENAPAPAKATVQESKPEQKPQAEAPVKPKPEPPKKELAMDLTDHAIPAGKPLDASEEAKRKAHEEAEAKRKAEWDAKQAAKKQAREEALRAIKDMSDSDVMSASTERVRKDVERLTRRNMKECVSEHLQNLCRKDPVFARKTMLPQKSMVHCFQYINRKAKDYIQQEMKNNDIQPENGVYGGDVPDGLCYQWAEDYFNDPDAQEDKEKEEEFIPRPYVGSSASKSKKAAKSKTTAKQEAKKQEPKKSYEQMTLGV